MGKLLVVIDGVVCRVDVIAVIAVIRLLGDLQASEAGNRSDFCDEAVDNQLDHCSC